MMHGWACCSRASATQSPYVYPSGLVSFFSVFCFHFWQGQPHALLAQVALASLCWGVASWLAVFVRSYLLSNVPVQGCGFPARISFVVSWPLGSPWCSGLLASGFPKLLRDLCLCWGVASQLAIVVFKQQHRGSSGGVPHRLPI